jgi:hypothetical protein
MSPSNGSRNFPTRFERKFKVILQVSSSASVNKKNTTSVSLAVDATAHRSQDGAADPQSQTHKSINTPVN